MLAHLRSPIFNLTGKPGLYMIQNDYFNHKQKIELKFSAWSYFTTKVCTNRMWGFEVNIHTEGLRGLSFYVKLCGRTYPVNFHFAASHRSYRYMRNPIFADGLMIKYEKGKLLSLLQLKRMKKYRIKFLINSTLCMAKDFTY
jgi:hypothetical protein